MHSNHHPDRPHRRCCRQRSSLEFAFRSAREPDIFKPSGCTQAHKSLGQAGRVCQCQTNPRRKPRGLFGSLDPRDSCIATASTSRQRSTDTFRIPRHKAHCYSGFRNDSEFCGHNSLIFPQPLSFPLAWLAKCFGIKAFVKLLYHCGLPSEIRRPRIHRVLRLCNPRLPWLNARGVRPSSKRTTVKPPSA